MNRVIKTEEGEYITIPDGDKATLREIIDYETENYMYFKGLK